MSRIGKKPIAIPSGVEIGIQDSQVTIKGPKGVLEYTHPGEVYVEKSDDSLTVKRKSDDQISRSMHGLVRSLIANMVTGVTKGFEKKLEIVGVGYKSEVKNKTLILNVGFSHQVEYPFPDGIEIECESPIKMTIKGIDKQKVGQTAAEIRKIRPPEPYKGKGIRYADEKVRRKAGKAGM